MGDQPGAGSGEAPSLDALMAGARRGRSLEEQRALAQLEQTLFDRRPRTVTVSRYVLLDRIGAGGVGLVYRAYDPELDRKVAIKVLQAASEDTGGRARLIREAQSLARLNHPNVVAVHDAGTYDEVDLGFEPGANPPDLEIPRRGVFLVMELVEGQDLHRWLSGGERPWEQILDIFTDAGRGLAAAHEAGIIHRDFKPSNVLLGSDGRVCVLDFGVARPVTRPSATMEAGADPAKADALATMEGAIVGTPRYMAPEQHDGGDADARSDQYAFAVSLHEALFRKLPFSGNYDDVVRQKAEGPPPLPTRPGVPPRVLTAIRQALDPDPAQRFPSMEAMLGALSPPAPARWPRVLVAASAVLSVGLLGGLFLARTSDDPCGGAQGHLESLWTPDAAALTRDAFVATGLAYAEPTFARVESAIDTFAQQWAMGYRDACEATHVRNEQSTETLDLRMQCLDTTLREASAVVERFQQADARVVERAIAAVEKLGTPESCADVATLATRLPPPRDPALRERLLGSRERLAQGRAAEVAGDYGAAIAIAQEVAEAGTQMEYPPLRAEALLRKASAQQGLGDYDDASKSLLDAIWVAEANRHDEVAADAWINLVWVDGVERVRSVDGERWVPFARAALERISPDPIRQATLEHNVAGVHYVRLRIDEALAGYRLALQMQEEQLGPENLTVARTLNHIGNGLMVGNSNFDRALEACSRSLDIRETLLGPDHPLVAASLSNISYIQRHLGRVPEARLTALRALEITWGTSGPEEWFAAHAVLAATEIPGPREEAIDALRRLIELAPAREPFKPEPTKELEQRLDRLLIGVPILPETE